MLEDPKPVGETDIDTWWRTYDVNVKVQYLTKYGAYLKGTYLPTRIFLTQPSLNGKTIINTSSIGSLFLAPGLSSYQSSKTAINRYYVPSIEKCLY